MRAVPLLINDCGAVAAVLYRGAQYPHSRKHNAAGEPAVGATNAAGEVQNTEGGDGRWKPASAMHVSIGRRRL